MTLILWLLAERAALMDGRAIHPVLGARNGAKCKGNSMSKADSIPSLSALDSLTLRLSYLSFLWVPLAL